MSCRASGPGWIRLWVVLAASAAVVLAGCGSPATEAPNPPSGQVPSGAQPADGPPAPTLSGEVSDDAAMVHLRALQKIADDHGGNRASGTPGYEASVDYVVGALRRAGFEVSTPAYEISEEDAEDGRAGTFRNVVAQTRTGDPGRVVMIGAHLDSVPEGPGIVDNGSGVASLLEIAARLGASPSVRNAVRFAFFGHEETGAQGSTGYVTGLSDAERAQLMLYLNVDMVASPNAGYFAQGGLGDDTSTAGPTGSASVGRVLADQLARTGVKPEMIEFVGDDESGFIEAGIPVGGAENGDSKRKTTAQANAWGGQAGQVYDRCYHQACDRIENVNQVVLGHYLRALAGTVGHFATSNETLR
ncbi:hypothetical protein GCM10023321_46750 [Pseudonocardia eucalypti]|uniref:Peptidase M28 domain-containing protein n=1 Tax=Pseudonocardia eucalypti TaxID=648755 RepID=A0ABP9QHH1_9PSEU|nr:aminopeptidase S [Pseudonocardia eucalypti]